MITTEPMTRYGVPVQKRLEVALNLENTQTVRRIRSSTVVQSFPSDMLLIWVGIFLEMQVRAITQRRACGVYMASPQNG